MRRVSNFFFPSTSRCRCDPRDALFASMSSTSQPSPSSSGARCGTGAGANAPTATQQQMKSTGILYLDTWMGRNEKKRQMAQPVASLPPRSPADTSNSALPHQSAAVATPTPLHHSIPSTSMQQPSIFNNTLLNRTSMATEHATNVSQAPYSSYQMITLRPNRHGDSGALRGNLHEIVKDHILHQQSSQYPCRQEDHTTTQTIIPIVLDLSALKSDDTGEGYLNDLVGTIRSYKHDQSSLQQTVNICIMGVTNSPPDIVHEGNTLGLPILYSNHTVLATNTNWTRMDASPSMAIRKKRGGVAPLLRQRRPGVASTRSSVGSDSTDESANSAKTSEEDTTSLHGTAPPSTKVHKGSVRSGQLVSSDNPHQSLVIIGSVNPGGEVWSEGDVYVFGKLRGRVLAGLCSVGGSRGEEDFDKETSLESRSNDMSKNNAAFNNDRSSEQQQLSTNGEQPKHNQRSSRIFATSFDPELVSIGNEFTTIDSVEALGLDGGAALVSLDEDTGELVFERIDL